MRAKEIVEITTQWNRPDENGCLPCHPMVCEGVIQCIHCLAFFDDKKVIQCLKDLYGATWMEEWNKLKTVKKMLRSGNVSNLRQWRYSYQGKDGSIVNERNFYEILPK